MKRIPLVLMLSLPLFCAQSWGDDVSKSSGFEGAVKDGWLTGKIEAVYTLNRPLNAFSINTGVENGMVHLTGMVESDIDRDLAGEIAKGIEGVVDVKNDLKVEASARQTAASKVDRNKRSFGTWVDDATTTAAVKSKLVGNSNTKGLQIDVDTWGDVVTLSGEVSSFSAGAGAIISMCVAVQTGHAVIRTLLA